jgi:hypothetical protein
VRSAYDDAKMYRVRKKQAYERYRTGIKRSEKYTKKSHGLKKPLFTKRTWTKELSRLKKKQIPVHDNNSEKNAV